MARGHGGAGSSSGRLPALWSELRASFGLPAGLAIVAGVVLGFTLPALDDLLDIELPTFAVQSQQAAVGLLETIATVTVSVAGLAFSVTVVAFTLTSQQLSPRVLRSFRSDGLSQAVLALFLGTFTYCLALLVRLGSQAEGVPNLSITIALLLALASFMLFAVFVGHIATMLQPSTVIARIVDEAKGELGHRFPSAIGCQPERAQDARERADEIMGRAEPLDVHADEEGYLTLLDGERVLTLAAEHDLLVRQCVPIGDYVTPAQLLAEVWPQAPSSGTRGRLSEDQLAQIVCELRGAFVLARQRSLDQDIAFSIRQLADIALKGLSPGVNDPTTAENAADAMTALLIRFARSDQLSPVRVDADATPRLVSQPPELDDLVRLGFEQVRVFAEPYPVVGARLLTLLERIEKVAREAEISGLEAARQAALLRPDEDPRVRTDEPG